MCGPDRRAPRDGGPHPPSAPTLLLSTKSTERRGASASSVARCLSSSLCARSAPRRSTQAGRGGWRSGHVHASWSLVAAGEGAALGALSHTPYADPVPEQQRCSRAFTQAGPMVASSDRRTPRDTHLTHSEPPRRSRGVWPSTRRQHGQQLQQQVGMPRSSQGARSCRRPAPGCPAGAGDPRTPWPAAARTRKT
jgi:hypothetical protein